MPFPLETERLLLRRVQDDDLEPFFAYRNDFPVAQYQGWEFPYPHEQAVAFIEEMKTKDPNIPGDWFQAAIELKANHETIGDVAFQIMKDDPRQAYIGYTLARTHWWKGYGAESVRRLVDYLFRELNLYRVVACCDVENVSSYHLLERNWSPSPVRVRLRRKPSVWPSNRALSMPATPGCRSICPAMLRWRWNWCSRWANLLAQLFCRSGKGGCCLAWRAAFAR